MQLDQAFCYWYVCVIQIRCINQWRTLAKNQVVFYTLPQLQILADKLQLHMQYGFQISSNSKSVLNTKPKQSPMLYAWKIISSKWVCIPGRLAAYCSEITEAVAWEMNSIICDMSVISVRSSKLPYLECWSRASLLIPRKPTCLLLNWQEQEWKLKCNKICPSRAPFIKWI